MKMRGKLILIGIVPMIVVLIVTLLSVSASVTKAMVSEVTDALKATAYALRDDITNDEENYYYINEAGELWNADSINVSEMTDGIDLIKAETNIVATVFLGDTRYLTSIIGDDGKRVIGTQASAAIYNEVVKGAKEYFSDEAVVNGSAYYAVYIPLYDDTSSIPVGMVFAGKPQATVQGAIKSITGSLVLLAVVAVVFIVIIVGMLAVKMSKKFIFETEVLGEVAKGNLTVENNPAIEAAKDESGDIARSVNELTAKLGEIIKDIKAKSEDVNALSNGLGESCEQTALNIEQVEQAVTEIAKGATSQAEDTTKATEEVVMMGNLVETTNENVEKLNADSDEMEKNGREAGATIEQLQKVNSQAKESIDVIYEQTNTTNDSAQKIYEAVSIITSIAEETNLLSLNASIEAARAGEQGKGFAVVAGQISKLAEQSSDSAKRIEDIVKMLITDSTKAVETMDQVKQIMAEQSTMVAEAGEKFDNVMEGIENSRLSTKNISETMQELNKTRETVVDIVSNLSAIAEENAASTQQTSASVTVVSATVQEISAEAIRLKGIADELQDSVKIFRV